jgi:hypothetical protein
VPARPYNFGSTQLLKIIRLNFMLPCPDQFETKLAKNYEFSKLYSVPKTTSVWIAGTPPTCCLGFLASANCRIILKSFASTPSLRWRQFMIEQPFIYNDTITSRWEALQNASFWLLKRIREAVKSCIRQLLYSKQLSTLFSFAWSKKGFWPQIKGLRVFAHTLTSLDRLNYRLLYLLELHKWPTPNSGFKSTVCPCTRCRTCRDSCAYFLFFVGLRIWTGL